MRYNHLFLYTILSPVVPNFYLNTGLHVLFSQSRFQNTEPRYPKLRFVHLARYREVDRDYTFKAYVFINMCYCQCP